MKERRKGFIAGVLASTILMGLAGTAAATVGSRTISADYNNIKISVNGSVITPTDANGQTVEPFAINGTTYLPVRAVADALDISVNWDEKNKTVVLYDAGNKKALDILQMLDLCVTIKTTLEKQKALNQSVSNYISLSFSAPTSSELNDIKTEIQSLSKELVNCLSGIYLIQNECERLRGNMQGTQFYYYCDGIKITAEYMMKSYEYQVEAYRSAQNYCGYRLQSEFDNYLSKMNDSSLNISSAEYTYQSVYSGIYSESVKELT